jgi:hypothetical protein
MSRLMLNALCHILLHTEIVNLDTEVDINKAWETIRENIKVSAKESLGYYELKKHKPMLGGSLVTTAWRVLRLRMEGTPSRYGG